MMLTLIRSPVPAIPADPAAWPKEIAEQLRTAHAQPERCLWLLPSEQRLHAMRRSWQGGSLVTPRFLTFAGFVSLALSYGSRPRRLLSVAERLPRLARAWQTPSGRSVGSALLRSLDRLVYDWQVCAAELESAPGPFPSFLQQYLQALERDEVVDEAGSLRALLDALEDPADAIHTVFLKRFGLVVVDGFHRLEPLQVHLLAELSRRVELLVWLVGSPGQSSWRTLELTGVQLARRQTQIRQFDYVPPPLALAAVGRRLFPTEGQPGGGASAQVAALYGVDAAGPLEEVERLARQIKADLRADRSLRSSDIAIVIPDERYAALVSEMFERTGLPLNTGSWAEPLARSRPARPLLTAWQLIRSSWRHDALADFLHLSVVCQHLREPALLGRLWQHRPRARGVLSAEQWLAHWGQYVDALERRLRQIRAGEERFEAGPGRDLEGHLEKGADLVDRLRRLIDSIRAVLNPVQRLEAALTDQHETALPRLAQACQHLLESLNMPEWLGEGAAASPSATRCDQASYARLMTVLEVLSRLPEDPGRSDAWTTLLVVLENESIPRESPAEGVQLLEFEQLAGLSFRHVYALGLTADLVPRLPEEGAHLSLRRQSPQLRLQLQQKEAEAAFHFSQLFESARERLVLSWPRSVQGEPAECSPFYLAVAQAAVLPRLAPVNLVATAADAARELGRAVAQGYAWHVCGDELWSMATAAPWLRALHARVEAWQARRSWWRLVNRIDSEPLLRLLFPDSRPFNPSDLETYAACPFRYLGLRVLKLEDQESDQTRVQYGSLVHRVLQRFYLELRTVLQFAAHEPLPAVMEAHRPLLARLFEEECRQLGDPGVPPHLRKLFACDQGVGQLFLDAMAYLEAQHGNVLNEFSLEDADRQPVLLGHDSSGRPVYLTGRLDRVDVHRERPTEAVIIDYKTGKSGSSRQRREKIEDGRMLQLPLYAAAMSVVRPDLTVVGGAYVYLNEGIDRPDRALGFAGEWAPGKSGEVPFDPDAARRMALTLASEMRGGRFPLTRHPEECTAFCALRHVCQTEQLA